MRLLFFMGDTMIFNKSKLRKIETVDDMLDAYSELQNKSNQLIDKSTLTYDVALKLVNAGLLDIRDFEYIVTTLPNDYDAQRKLNEIKFRNNTIDFKQYTKTNIEIDKIESIENSKQKPIGVNVDRKDWVVDPYIQSNIDYQYSKATLELEFRTGDLDFYDYEIQMADLNNEPYAKVLFEPDYENNTKTLNVNARFNEYFTNDLKQRDEFTPQFDDEGRLIKDDLVEQWFSTAIIVMAANMLKETDLDIFRSVTNDNPGVPIIEELQFDDETLDQFNEIEKQQLQEIEKNGRIYR